MKELSVFIDESGSFGEYDRQSPYYIIAMVFHDQSISNQMKKTIKPLIPKIDLLNEIRERFDATFTLEVVPSICCEHEKPCISPSMKVIDFCSKARADLNIDWYMDNT